MDQVRMLNFFKLFKMKEKRKGLTHFLDIGTCGLHTRGSFKAGIEKKKEWQMTSLMKHPSINFMTLQLDRVIMKL